MATADQIKALLLSHVAGDDERFYAVALQVAASEARAGHGKLALELRKLVDDAKTNDRSPNRPIPLAQPRGELGALLAASYPKTRLSDMALAASTEERLRRVLHEQTQRSRLHARGFTPYRKLLLVGPPGTGKTMTASVLAGELGLPLLTIRFDGLITKYMGETAAKLRLVFDAMTQTRGVYFFDEFDAVGSQRSSLNDVGEIRRVLNSFLQFLENDESDSVIVAATNHIELLDRALFRRFDLVIEYDMPSPVIGERVMRDRLATLDTSQIDWAVAAVAAQSLSHADIARAAEHAAKAAILTDTSTIETSRLIEALRDRRVSIQTDK